MAFGTVADLAGQAGAGAATVVRLAGKLGFDGFSALQSSIRRDLSHQLRPAVERIRELEGTRTTERHRAAAQCNVQATLDGVDHADLDKAVQLLGDLAHPVLVLAGDAQHGIARQFVHDLGALRAGVEILWGPRRGRATPDRHQLAGIDAARDRPSPLRVVAARRAPAPPSAPATP